MGLESWFEGETTFGKAAIGDFHRVPGTPYPRISVLATMVDVVAGSRPTGPINPTVDLRVHLMELVPMSSVRVRCDVLRAGRRLFVAHSLLYADDAERPFGRSVVTFMNRQMHIPSPGAERLTPRPPPQVGGRVDDLLSVRPADEMTVEIDPTPGLSNGPGGTVQGGVLALLGELATERALGHPAVAVTDLDIRYLSPVRVGPVQAKAEVHFEAGSQPAADVRITDAGNAGALVASVMTIACRL